MKPLTSAESREVDRWAVEKLGLPSIVLMENAGWGTVDVLLAQTPKPRKVVILCGKGSNGGDGFVMARHLAVRKIDVQVALLAAAEQLAGDAQVNYRALQGLGISSEDLSTADDLASALDQIAAGADWVIDAMLGTGSTGEPREPIRSAIHWLNRQTCKKLAVDLPSGSNCDTGVPSSATVRADITCTFHAAKIGFSNPQASEFLGELVVVPIGIPNDLPPGIS